MIVPKDFATGCLTILIIILCIALIPIFFFFFKVSLFVAIPLAIIGLVIFGVTVVGKIVRLIFFKKS